MEKDKYLLLEDFVSIIKRKKASNHAINRFMPASTKDKRDGRRAMEG